MIHQMKRVAYFRVGLFSMMRYLSMPTILTVDEWYKSIRLAYKIKILFKHVFRKAITSESIVSCLMSSLALEICVSNE